MALIWITPIKLFFHEVSSRMYSDFSINTLKTLLCSAPVYYVAFIILSAHFARTLMKCLACWRWQRLWAAFLPQPGDERPADQAEYGVIKTYKLSAGSFSLSWRDKSALFQSSAWKTIPVTMVAIPQDEKTVEVGCASNLEVYTF